MDIWPTQNAKQFKSMKKIQDLPHPCRFLPYDVSQKCRDPDPPYPFVIKKKSLSLRSTNFQCDRQSLGIQKNHATPWDKKIMQPLGTKKKSCNLLGLKKITQLLGTKKSRNLFGEKKITRPLGTKQKSPNLSG